MHRKQNLIYSAARLLAIVFLILIENVSHIGGYGHQQYLATTGSHTAAVAVVTNGSSAVETAMSGTHRLAKRMDLESCLGQFDVHKNTIIRTGESQAIGGKYLQGLELDTMEECQRLCCETEACDVYIFENKNDGYCYLFECGPPENFHCKFTRHANYTSAVLTSAHLRAEVTTTRPSLPQIGSTNISQQELELTSLKVKPDVRDNKAAAESVATAVGAAQTLQAEMGLQKATNISSHCGRFQFSCHSGECIAVYNACDGIPQCEDGSDEGPECSGASSNAVKTNIEAGNINALEPMVQKPQYQPPLLQQTPQQQLQNMQQQTQPGIMPPLINNREDAAAWANRKMVADTQQVDAAKLADLNSRIFSHKGGLQVPTNGMGVTTYGNANPNLNPMYAATLQRSGIYMPQTQQDVTGGMYAMAPQQQILQPQGHIIVPPNVNWQQQQQQSAALRNSPTGGLQLPSGPAYMLNAAQQTQPRLLQQQPAQPKPIMQLMSPVQPQAATALPAGSVSSVNTAGVAATNKISQASEKQALQTAPEEAVEYEYYEEESTEPPKKKQRKHKKIKSKFGEPKALPQPQSKDPIELALQQQKQENSPASPVHEQYKMIHENLAIEFRDHDGQSDRPSGAMLSLTLGVLITAALAILIGCRMRTVGRPRRLGGKTPYAHEADFLVNGMYL